MDQARDGNSTEDHLEGIKYIKSVLEKGAKILPVLVRDNEDGTYLRLDGFKRCLAQKELGYKNIEAFVCSEKEYRDAVIYPYGKYEIRCYHGGQDGDNGKLPLFEGGEMEDFDYNKVKFLYKSPDSHGLRIELTECIHVHWGEYGRYRLALGEEDFIHLAKAFESWE